MHSIYTMFIWIRTKDKKSYIVLLRHYFKFTTKWSHQSTEIHMLEKNIRIHTYSNIYIING
jgi:hypothetical protein